jgi:putative hydroxymethylpyrimidine transport system substrate-binding protein
VGAAGGGGVRRAPLVLVALCVAALVLAGCGEREEKIEPGAGEPLELMLDFFPNADHAGIYAAEAGGHFRDVGLDVTVRTPPDPAAPIKQVAAGRVDLAVSYEPEVLRARDQGLNVVSVGALVREPLTSIISLPEGRVRRPEDLRGKTVGTAGIDYQSAYLRTILQEAGVPQSTVKERNVGFDLVPALLTKKVDAVLGGFWNYEAVDLRRRRKRPSVIKVQDAGVPDYAELVLVANGDALESNPGRIRRFVGALSRGTRDLERDPDPALRALLEANDDLDLKLQREVLRLTLPLFLPPRGKPFGWQDGAAWARFARWMQTNGLLKRPPHIPDAVTNRALPGEGL